MEWMVHYDRYGGSCSVKKGTGPYFTYEKCCSLDVVEAELNSESTLELNWLAGSV